MATLQIRPGLDITIQTVPGSAWIRFWLPNSQPVSFNPKDSSFHYFEDSPPLKEVLESVTPDDLEQVKSRLLQHNEKRLQFFAKANTSPSIPLNPAYKKTLFEYLPHENLDTFWVITAYDPDGKNAAEDENKAADRSLHDEIEKLGFTPFRVIGKSPDERHVEPGWGIPCDAATALDLGKLYRQEAVFNFHPGGINLVGCRSGEIQPLDEPENRIFAP